MSRPSDRSLYKVTYAPIRPGPDDVPSGAVARLRRGLEKVAFANALRPTAAEAAAAARLREEGDPPGAAAALELMAQLADVTKNRGARLKLIEMAPADLVGAGRALARHRRARRAVFVQEAEKLIADHAAAAGAQLEAARAVSRPATPSRRPVTAALARMAAAAQPAAAAVPAGKSALASALKWARAKEPSRAVELAALARELAGLAIDDAALRNADWDHFIVGVAEEPDASDPNWTDDLSSGFEDQMKVEPIGRLHLERIDMTPIGIVRGELVHSVGLSPKETVTLIHREWSSRTTSFEQVVSQEFEQSKEDSVTENTELASAIDTQSRHSSAMSLAASASGGWGFASASASIGYNTTSDDSTAKHDSRNHSMQVSSKAASRTRQEHKSTFTVKEEAGVEDQSVRVVTNPSETEPMRIDFHQMIRKWQVDLYRYGLRLTYDIVVPAPGIDLLAQVDELRKIDETLAQPFQFNLSPDAVTRQNWPELAAQYGADVDPPDPVTIQLQQSFSYALQSEVDANVGRIDAVQFDCPTGYTVTRGELHADILFYQNGNFDVENDFPPEISASTAGVNWYDSGLELLIGRTGRLDVVMYAYGLKTGHVQATLEVTESDESFQAWQAKAWGQMRKGAQDLHSALMGDLKARRDELDAKLKEWDPLTLRRMEREEVMKTTLRWILGPDFDLMPSTIEALYTGDPGGVESIDPSGLTQDEWAHVMRMGELIKFLHEAVEWENVLYFIYPYFWDAPRNQPLKRFLHHPDSLHETFLRGGAARVVLTVRPGFEHDFTQLFETSFKEEPIPGDDHPYMTIADEIRAYAETNYPGIPAADGDNVPSEEEIDAGRLGKRIARWYEYTPVSALDITVNTPLADLR